MSQPTGLAEVYPCLVGKEAVTILQGKSQGTVSRAARLCLTQCEEPVSWVGLRPVEQSLQQRMSREKVAWSSTLVCGAQLPRRSSEVYFSYTIEGGALHPSGSLDKCLGTPDGEWGISPGAYHWVALLCRHVCSGHVCRCLRWASLIDVSGLELNCHG